MPNLLLDPAQRSHLMSSIRSKGTRPELIAFSELRSRGVTFRRHYDRVAGKPDIARPRKKLAVFIDGDFWHGREIQRVVDRYGVDSAWAIKLRRNVSRDLAQMQELEAGGWRVLRVWASDVTRLRTRAEAIDLIVAFLKSRD